MANPLENLLVQAERVKLARVLEQPADKLRYLDRIPSDQLRELRERLTSAFFNENRAVFEKVAGASKLMPETLIAKLSERVFGPVLSARIAGFMPPERTAKVAAAMHPPFLAEVSLALEPSRASALLQRLPTRLIVEVGQVLLAREEYLVMARFVDNIALDAIHAVVAKISSDETLLRIACYVENPARLEEITESVPPTRLRGIVRSAAEGSDDLQLAGLLLIGQVSSKMKRRIGDIAMELGEATLTKLLDNARRQGAGEVIAEVLVHMSEQAQRKAATHPAARREDVIADMVHAAAERDLWPGLLPLLSYMDESARGVAVKLLDKLDEGLLRKALEAATKHKLLAPLVDIVKPMRASARKTMREQAKKLGVWDALGPLRAVLEG